MGCLGRGGIKKQHYYLMTMFFKNDMDRSKVLPVLDGGGEGTGTSTRPDFQTKKKMEEYHSHTVSIYGVSSKTDNVELEMSGSYSRLEEFDAPPEVETTLSNAPPPVVIEEILSEQVQIDSKAPSLSARGSLIEKHAESQAAESHAAESQAAESQAAESQAAESQAAEESTNKKSEESHKESHEESPSTKSTEFLATEESPKIQSMDVCPSEDPIKDKSQVSHVEEETLDVHDVDSNSIKKESSEACAVEEATKEISEETPKKKSDVSGHYAENVLTEDEVTGFIDEASSPKASVHSSSSPVTKVKPGKAYSEGSLETSSGTECHLKGGHVWTKQKLSSPEQLSSAEDIRGTQLINIQYITVVPPTERSRSKSSGSMR